jgi:NMD protein affecting ribosome stability and mRNA decay
MERRERARRIRKLGLCPACGHPWSEHPGSGNDFDGMCSECYYEFDHEQRETADPGCRLSIPAIE